MLKRQLAQELRQRQYKAKLVEREIVDSLSDDAIIDSYITCSGCGQKQVDEQQIRVAISLAKNSEHFFQICDQIGTSHHKAH